MLPPAVPAGWRIRAGLGPRLYIPVRRAVGPHVEGGQRLVSPTGSSVYVSAGVANTHWDWTLCVALSVTKRRHCGYWPPP
jgi:hypothetical protein